MFSPLKWIDRRVEWLLQRKAFIALFHVPVLGAVMALLFGITFVGRWKELPFALKQGIAAQVFFPGVFAAITSVKFLLYLLEFDLLHHLLFNVLAAYLVAIYALMLYGAKEILLKGSFKYPFAEPYVEMVLELFFGKQ